MHLTYIPFEGYPVLKSVSALLPKIVLVPYQPSAVLCQKYVYSPRPKKIFVVLNPPGSAVNPDSLEPFQISVCV
jgi:hypothetical protein